MPPPAEFKYKWIHDIGKFPCFNIAFYCKKKYSAASSDYLLPDGTVPYTGATIRCGYCGEAVQHLVDVQESLIDA